jgi:hypothetical protein
MPNRIIREGIIDSARVNQLSFGAEVFYRRLMSVVDDFGRFDGRIDLLRAKLFPVKLAKVGEKDIEAWLKECIKNNLILLYCVESKNYIEIIDFNQSIRIMKSKYPQPSEIICAQMKSNESTCMSESNPIHIESKQNTNRKSIAFIPPSLLEIETYSIENGFSKELAKKAFDYYEAGNWHDSKNNPVKNWKQKMLSVWFKPENRLINKVQTSEPNGKRYREL